MNLIEFPEDTNNKKDVAALNHQAATVEWNL